MTLIELKELIDELAEDETLHNKQVMTAYDYGGHCHTQALSHVGDVVEHAVITSVFRGSCMALCADEKGSEDSVIAII